jgi:hypothetical protein
MKPRTDPGRPAHGASDDCGTTRDDLAAILDQVMARAAILRDELKDYVRLEIDNLKRGVRRLAVNAILGVSGALGVVAVVVTSVVFCLSGLAALLGEATGRPWLGSLLAGVFGLGLCIGGLMIARVRLRGRPVKEGECP